MYGECFVVRCLQNSRSYTETIFCSILKTANVYENTKEETAMFLNSVSIYKFTRELTRIIEIII